VSVPWNKGKRGYTNSGSFKKGHSVSEKTRQRVSETSKGNKYRLGKSHTEETKERISKTKTGKYIGENNPNWKGGYSENYRLRRTQRYKKWREKVFERDNYTCRNCGKTNCYITAHHIKSLARFKELVCDTDNGITLCEDCHKLTDNYKGKARRILTNKKG